MKKIVHFIASAGVSLYLVVLAIGALLVFSIAGKLTTESAVSFRVPTDATVHVRLDSRDAIAELLQSVLLDGAGQKLIQNSKKQLQKEGGGEKGYGIDVLQPVHYFIAIYKGATVQGLIVHVSDGQQWNAEINKLFGNVSVAVRKGRSGMVVQSKTLSREDLYAFIHTHVVASSIPVASIAENAMVDVRVSNVNMDAELHVVANKSALNVKGVVELKDVFHKGGLHFQLVSNGFSVATDIVVPQVLDSLKKSINADFPLSGLSVNYQGLEVTESDQGFFVLPKGELILGFSKKYALDSFLQILPNWKWNESGKSISLDGEVYFIQQLDDQTIYIGQKKHPEIRKVIAPIGIQIKGSLKPIVHIEASSFVRMAIRMNPIIGTLNKLSQVAELVEVRVLPISGNQYDLSARLQFRKDRNALVELFTMLIEER